MYKTPLGCFFVVFLFSIAAILGTVMVKMLYKISVFTALNSLSLLIVKQYF